ncbi:DUF4382 domain-containing protein [Thalassotalea ponticola]|uniref:DUF4382 domain-containing protein n=1 Tax=Thalassotalea ponticola TaxID=1523392 RepID=UPI0025B43B97|nr:DUF4382 domain-containing protein [Thalassotalea ponticola]MDN3651779.1 DUF4382 domain-containing protein [Thalassotalea ponticola]
MNNKFTNLAGAVALALSLVGCGGDSDNETKVAFSLGVSDAPVDGAKQVVVSIDQIKLIPVNSDDGSDDNGRDTVVIDTFDGADMVTVDLLQYTGSDQLTIINEDDGIEVALGSYKMELVVDNSQSWVTLDDDVQYDLKVPSTRLKLGQFDVVLGATQTAEGPAYTVEFDLRQSLVLRGNDAAKNGFIVKPHGVRITASSSSGHIAGDVDLVALINESELSGVMPTCTGESHTVYLYQGDQTGNELNLIDNIDVDDIEYIVPSADALPENPVSPFASTKVEKVMVEDDNGTAGEVVEYRYQFGFVPNGEGFATDVDANDAVYTLAFACNVSGEGYQDDPVQYDGLLIANPVDQLAVVNVLTGETVISNFPVATEAQ